MSSLMEISLFDCQTPTVSKPRCFNFNFRRVNEIEEVDELFAPLLLSKYSWVVRAICWKK